jgi:CubicO group peptidase (beta-lactamase class C family)
MLVEDGLLQWKTPYVARHSPTSTILMASSIHDILRDLSRSSPLFRAKINVLDILSHRTGTAASEALYMQGNNRVLARKDDSIAIFDTIPIVAPPRTKLLYSNQAYNLLGLVIERLSGMSYGDFVQRRIFDPLQMTRSCSEHNDDPNMASPYSVLLNETTHRLPHSTVGGQTSMFAGQSIRSTLTDQMAFYEAYLKSLPMSESGQPSCGAPLKQLSTLIQPRIVLPTAKDTNRREQTHACAINRTQLPGPMSFGWNRRFVEELPNIGREAPSTLLLWVNGYMPGVTTKACLLPEHEAVIVVMQNSLGLTDAADWISSLLLDALLTGRPGYDYLALAKRAAGNWGKRMVQVETTLATEQIPDTKPRELGEYIGRYWNGIKNWLIEVGVSAEGELWMRMQGRTDEQYKLRHYHHDTFVWNMDYDSTARSGQICRPAGYWKINFEPAARHCSQTAGCISMIRWQHDPLVEDGEVFTKAA